jgi:hypothetical protein
MNASYKLLQGSLSVHFCPSSCLDDAALIASFPEYELHSKSSSYLLSLTKLENSHRLQSVLGALAKLPRSYFDERLVSKEHIVNLSLSIINAENFSPYLLDKAIRLFCLIENPFNQYQAIETSLHKLLCNSYIPDELVESLISMSVDVIINSPANSCFNLLELFVSKITHICQPDQSVGLRISASKAIQRLLPFMNITNPQFVDICILVDGLLSDDNEIIRNIGVDIVTDFLKLKVII